MWWDTGWYKCWSSPLEKKKFITIMFGCFQPVWLRLFLSLTSCLWRILFPRSQIYCFRIWTVKFIVFIQISACFLSLILNFNIVPEKMSTWECLHHVLTQLIGAGDQRRALQSHPTWEWIPLVHSGDMSQMFVGDDVSTVWRILNWYEPIFLWN